MKRNGLAAFLAKISLVLAALVILAMVACAAPAASPAATSSSKPTTAPAASTKPAAVPAPSQTFPAYRLAIATAETGASSHIIASVISALLSKNTDGKIRLSVIPTSGAVDAADRLGHGEVDLDCATSSSDLYLFSHSEGPWAGSKPFPVFNLFPHTLTLCHTLLKADSPIEKWDDLVGKKVQLGTPGSSGAATFSLLLKMMGVLEKTSTVSLSFDAGINALADNKIDIALMVTGAPNALVTEFATTRPIKFLDFPKSLVDRCNQEIYKGSQIRALTVLKKGIYPNMLRDANLMASWQTWVVKQDFPEDAAYWITKTVWDNLEELKKTNPPMRTVSDEAVRQLPADTTPFHPGALRYYKEKGILK